MGWALGRGSCTGCARIWRTVDGGTHWTTVASTVHLPGHNSGDVIAGLVRLKFVSAEVGYLFVSSSCSQACALVTRDGGRTWYSSHLPEAGQVVTGGDTLYALSGYDGHPTELLRTTPGSSRWTALALPRISTSDNQGFVIAADHTTLAVLRIGSAQPAPMGATVTQADRGALWISTTRGDEFTRVNIPCLNSDGEASLVSVALDHPDALFLDCYDGEQSSQQQSTQHHLYGSGDGGRTWKRLADPSDTGGPGFLADNGDGHAFFVSEGGLGYQLHVSLDGAANWHVALHGGAGGFRMVGLDFITASTGFALGPTPNASEQIYRTVDAGRTWHRLPPPIA